MSGVRVVGLDALIHDLETYGERLSEEMPKVVRKGAQNIKDEWRASWGRLTEHGHIRPMVRGIGYDTDSTETHFRAEIGVSVHNPQAPLAHLIAYGSINNPPHDAGLVAMDAEDPRFVDAVADAAVRLLDE